MGPLTLYWVNTLREFMDLSDLADLIQYSGLKPQSPILKWFGGSTNPYTLKAIRPSSTIRNR